MTNAPSENAKSSGKSKRLFDARLTEEQIATAKDPIQFPTSAHHEALDFLLLDSDQHIAIAQEEEIEYYDELALKFGHGADPLADQVSYMALAALRASLIAQSLTKPSKEGTIN